MREQWKQIKGFEGLYEVSDLGQVRSVERCVMRRDNAVIHVEARQLKQAVDSLNRRRITLKKDGKHKSFFVHRLVLEAFIGSCPDGMECCHNDGDPSNNCLSNLRWDTHKANIEDKQRHNTAPKGERNNLSKLTETQVAEIIRRRFAGERGIDLAREFGVTDQTISNIYRRKSWSHAYV